MILRFLLCLMLVPSLAMAASSATTTIRYDVNGEKVVVINWTTDTDGSFSNYTTTEPLNCRVDAVTTDPGSTAPTDNYDITLVDKDSLDLLQARGANRDTANTEILNLLMDGAYREYFVDGPVTLTLSGNSVASATGKTIIKCTK